MDKLNLSIFVYNFFQLIKMDHQYCDSNSYVYSVEIQDNSDICIEEKDGDAFLIELYRERPFLYNKGHNEFKNKVVKDNAWNEISKIMQDKNYGELCYFSAIYFITFHY